MRMATKLALAVLLIVASWEVWRAEGRQRALESTAARTSDGRLRTYIAVVRPGRLRCSLFFPALPLVPVLRPEQVSA